MPGNGFVDRRRFIGVTGLAAGSLLARGRHAVAALKRPNVLLLHTDQQHHNTLGCGGNPLIQTPNLDALAQDGVRFTNALCATPFCSPSRASWVTGQWPHTTGRITNVQGNDQWMTDEHWNLPNVLHDAGYRCAHYGKWHLGRIEDIRAYAHQGTRQDRNRPYNQLLRNGLKLDHAKIPEPRVGWQHVDMIPAVAAFHKVWKDEERRSPQDLSIIGKGALPPEYQYESWLADECIRFVEQNRDGPFFATYSVSPPHAFWVAPDPYYSMYDPADIPLPKNRADYPKMWPHAQGIRIGEGLGEEGLREYLRCYYAQVTMMDAFMGRIIDRLKQLGLYDNTIILFTSDHGDMQAGHGCVGKSLPTYYEEILRVPFIAKVPGSRKAAVCNTHTVSPDVAPTMLDCLGLPIPDHVQGRSIRGLIDGTEPEDLRPGLCERGVGKSGTRMIRSGQWKYCIYVGPKGGVYRELFNLQEDPWEMTNLAGNARFADLWRHLHQQLCAELERNADDRTVEALLKI